MSSLIFWNVWPATQKRLFQVLLILFVAAVAICLFGYFSGAKLLIQWETISKVSSYPLLLETWNFASIPLDITVDQFLITQIFEGSDLKMATWPAAIMLLVMAVCLIVGLSLAVNLSRFWFLTSQVALIFALVGFKLEQLLLFGRTDKIALILAFALFLPIGYYFHSISKQDRLGIRLLVYTTITGLFAGLVYFFSEVQHPFLYLANYGIVVPLLLSTIFILFIGHEVIYGFLVAITRNNTPASRNSFVHFFTLSVIYLVNVLLLYLRNNRRIDWDLYYLDAFWVLLAAAVIGLWSLKRRSNLYSNIMPAEPHAVTGYLALATICFTTIGYFFATANDPAIEALEDIIVFSQLSIGFVFLLYILFNFRSVLIANLKVYKVVYDPKKMPFFSMRLGGFIGVLGLFLLSNQYPLDQAITAYYNGIGDLHRIDEQPMLAKEYYKLAGVYAKTNHRSNYAIAAMEREDRDLSEALAYFKQSTLKQPTPFAFVNTARSYEDQGMFFKAMFTLKDGLGEFPGNPHISNNLSALYAKTNLLDSAYYFLGGLANVKQVAKEVQANQLALLTKSELSLPTDSLYRTVDHYDPAVGNNLMVLANNQSQLLAEQLQMPVDSLLNPITFAWWYNYHLNNLQLPDTVTLNQLYYLSEIPENHLYEENLKLAAGLRFYYSGFRARAFKSLMELQYEQSRKAGFYNDILGQWSLKQQQPILAIEFLDQSIRAGYLPALEHKVLALIMSGDLQQAKVNWGHYKASTQENVTSEIDDLLNYLTAEASPLDSLSDKQKLWYIQFKAPLVSLEERYKWLDKIGNPELHEMAANWIWSQAIKIKDTRMIERFAINNPSPGRLLQKAIIEKDEAQIDALLNEINSPNQQIQSWVTYGQALLAEHQGDHQQAAELYRQLTRDPFFEEGIVQAAKYFESVSDDDFQRYNILVNAIEINRYSVRILKAYGKACVQLNLDTYKNSTLETLSQLITPNELNAYLDELNTLEQRMLLEFSEN